MTLFSDSSLISFCSTIEMYNVKHFFCLCQEPQAEPNLKYFRKLLSADGRLEKKATEWSKVWTTQCGPTCFRQLQVFYCICLAYKKDRFGCLEIFPIGENSDCHGVETKEESRLKSPKIATKYGIVDAGEIPSIGKLQ